MQIISTLDSSSSVFYVTAPPLDDSEEAQRTATIVAELPLDDSEEAQRTATIIAELPELFASGVVR